MQGDKFCMYVELLTFVIQAMPYNNAYMKQFSLRPLQRDCKVTRVMLSFTFISELHCFLVLFLINSGNRNIYGNLI